MLNEARKCWIVSGQRARAKTKTLFIDLHVAVTSTQTPRNAHYRIDAFFTQEKENFY